MPYIPEVSRREILIDDPYQSRTVGEVNFVFSNLILNRFNAAPSYNTLNKLREIVNTPSVDSDFENVFYQVAKNGSLNHGDIRAALDNAWDEFYIRVGRPYEDAARFLNGDLPGYTKALDFIKEKTNVNPSKLSVVTTPSNSSKTV